MFHALDKGIRVLLFEEPSFECCVKHFAHRSEVVANLMNLLDYLADKLEIGIVFASEVKHRHIACLSVAIKATVSLFEPRGIPWDVEVEDHPRSLLKV